MKATRSASTAVLQSVVGRFGVIAVTAFTGVLSARHLHPDGRGELAAMILWPAFLSSALTFGIPSATIYRLKQSPDREQEIVGAALLLSMISGILGCVLAWMFMPVWLVQYSAETISDARLFLLTTIPCAIVLAGRASLESRGEFRFSSMLLLVPAVLAMICLVVLLAAGKLTPVSAAFAYVGPGLPYYFYLFYCLWRDVRPRIHRFFDNSASLMSYGIRAYGIDLCGTLALYVDQALVVRLLPPAQMGIYVVALSLSRVLNVFHVASIVVLFPKSAAQQPERVLNLTGRAVRISTLLSLPCGLGVVLCGKMMLRTVYGPSYANAGDLLNILCLEVLLSGVALVLSQAFLSLGRPGVLTVCHTVGLLTTVPLMLILAPSLGLTGVGLSLLCSTALRLSLVIAAFPLILKLQCPRLLPGPQDFAYLFSEIRSRLGQLRAYTGLRALD